MSVTYGGSSGIGGKYLGRKNDRNCSCWRAWPMLVVKFCGLGGRRVCMNSRWRAFVVPCHDHWL